MTITAADTRDVLQTTLALGAVDTHVYCLSPSTALTAVQHLQ
jgi:hypothetical protein